MATPRVTHHPRRVRTVSRLLAWLLAPFVGAFAFAQTAPAPTTLPQGGQVKVGAGQLTQSGNLLLIQQLTPRLGLDWQSFNIGSGATVEFRQPNAGAVAMALEPARSSACARPLGMTMIMGTASLSAMRLSRMTLGWPPRRHSSSSPPMPCSR